LKNLRTGFVLVFMMIGALVGGVLAPMRAGATVTFGPDVTGDVAVATEASGPKTVRPGDISV
jgi:hypothetical protein